MKKLQILKKIFCFALVIMLFANCSDSSSSPTKASWSPIQDFSGGDRTTNMCSTGTSLFIGTETKGVYRSTDYGKTWSQVNNGIVETKFCRVFSSGTTLYLSTNATKSSTNNNLTTFYKSVDNGNNWTPIWSSINNADIGSTYTIAFFGSTILIGCDSSVKDALNNRYPCIKASTDNGNSWKTSILLNQSSSLLLGSRLTYFQVVYDGSSFYAMDYTSQIFKSTNGSTFSYLSASDYVGMDASITTLGTKLFIGDYETGLSSTDGGVNWTRFYITPGDDFNNINTLYTNGATLYAGTVESVYISNDSGSTWIQLGEETSTGNDRVKQILKLDGYVFARVGYEIYRIAN